jgi:hypothetical protein
MEFVTICAILFALSGWIGIMASVFLTMTALTLAMKRGAWTLIMLAFSLAAADWSFGAFHDDGLLRQFMAISTGASLCTWFRVRAALSNPFRGRLG